ncbi:MAG: glycine--tRNA ligase subunit beta [Anaerolineaceae bacterium]|nr:glycine--tRNA ligase subunit beta [Anaerolineaceae bacterium]
MEKHKDKSIETTEAADLLLEIGVEEMPPGDIQAVVDTLGELCQQANAPAEVWVTPRRLAMYQRGVGAENLELEIEHRGPPARLAWDDAGQLTKAAIGFARSKGIAAEELVVKEITGGEYAVARVKRPIQEALAERIKEWFVAIRFPRTMRWDDSGAEFSRPIRWVVALWGDQIIPVQLAGLTAGRMTRGNRQYGSPMIELASAADYKSAMKEHGIVADQIERRAIIQQQLAVKAEEVGGQLSSDEELLDEVSHLVEAPTVFSGDYDQRFLALPDTVLTTVMKKHQRYFALRDQQGELLPHFLAVRNSNHENLEGVRRGNEQVLAARFTDAQFFYEQDRKQRLEDFLPRLDTLTFHEKLGSMRDKSQRLEQVVEPLAELLGYESSDVVIAREAARLCKADLATQMVVELTSLQGEIGYIYAREDGIDEEVAQAIYEHWLPRFDGDVLPQSKPGVLLALADRLDSLVGLFGAGERVTGSADLFGMRRLALSITRILIDQEINVPHAEIYQNIVELYRNQLDINDESVVEMNVFLQMRLYIWLPTYYPSVSCSDAVDAVMACNAHIPYRAYSFLQQLMDWVKKPNWEQILDAYARCWRIVPEQFPQDHEYSLRSSEAAERALYEAYGLARDKIAVDQSVDALLSAIEAMLPAITRFFDEVLVMAEDEALRNNRLSLLKHIAALADGIVDLRRMPGF